MTDLRTAAQQALEALLTYEQYIQPLTNVFGGPRVPEEGSASVKVDAAITTLRAALAEPVQEPVAWASKRTLDRIKDFDSTIYANGGFDDAVPLYIAPPQRKPMTEDEIELAYRHIYRNLPYEFDHSTPSWVEQGIRYAERAHGIGDSDA